MWRAAVSLVIGIALGGVGAYYYLAGGAERGVTLDAAVGLNSSAVPSAVNGPSATALPTVGGYSERSAVYQLAANADPASLRSLIEEGAARPESAERRFLLATLLSRYAESAPYDAISLVDDLELDTSILAALYGSWAGSDPAAALDAWRLAADTREARAIGLALFEALGGGEQAFSSVLTSLPPNLDAEYFQAEVIGLWAETAPEAALRKTLSLERRSTRERALNKVAWAWSERDPHAALGALGSIDDPELENAFRAAVIRKWSVFEPESALEHVIGLGDPSQRSMSLAHQALRRVAQSDPLRALELADRLPGPQTRWGQQVVVEAWATDDVMGALAYVENLPTGQQHQQLQQVIAHTYGKQDPAAAFAWARNLDPSLPGVLDAVVRGIASTDPVRAVDALLTLDSEEAQRDIARSIAMYAAYSGMPETLADRLAMLPDAEVKGDAVRALISNWASTDPESALVWLLANADAAGTSGFSKVAQQLGHADPAMAVRYTSKVPSAHREAWVEHVAAGYAQIDPTAAFDWISQFQGEPAYEAGLATMIKHSAPQDPRGAARMLETIVDSPHSANAASNIAEHWTRSEPRAAATWAQGLSDNRARMSAVSGVSRQWAKTDPRAAERWALEFDSASDRDLALVSVVTTIASKETPDAKLLNAFSSDTVRNQILPQVVYHVAQRDADAARRLIDEYVSDSHTRRQAEQYLLSARNR